MKVRARLPRLSSGQAEVVFAKLRLGATLDYRPARKPWRDRTRRRVVVSVDGTPIAVCWKVRDIDVSDIVVPLFDHVMPYVGFMAWNTIMESILEATCGVRVKRVCGWRGPHRELPR